MLFWRGKFTHFVPTLSNPHFIFCSGNNYFCGIKFRWHLLVDASPSSNNFLREFLNLGYQVAENKFRDTFSEISSKPSNQQNNSVVFKKWSKDFRVKTVDLRDHLWNKFCDHWNLRENLIIFDCNILISLLRIFSFQQHAAGSVCSLLKYFLRMRTATCCFYSAAVLHNLGSSWDKKLTNCSSAADAEFRTVSRWHVYYLARFFHHFFQTYLQDIIIKVAVGTI